MLVSSAESPDSNTQSAAAPTKRKRKDRASNEAAKGSPLWTVFHWTVKLAEYGHLAGMTGAEAKVWLAIFSYVSTHNHTAHPGVNTIAKLAGVDRATVFRAVAKLESKDLIERVRFGGGYHKRDTNEYQFKAPPERSSTEPTRIENATRRKLRPVAPVRLDPSHPCDSTRRTGATQTMPVNNCQLTGTGGGGGEASLSPSVTTHPAYVHMVGLKVWHDRAAELVQLLPDLTPAVVARVWEELRTDARVRQKENALVKRLKINGAALIEQHRVAEAERLERERWLISHQAEQRAQRAAKEKARAADYEQAIAAAEVGHVARYEANAQAIDAVLEKAGATRGTQRYDNLVLGELRRLGLWGHDAAQEPSPLKTMRAEQADALAFDALAHQGASLPKVADRSKLDALVAEMQSMPRSAFDTNTIPGLALFNRFTAAGGTDAQWDEFEFPAAA